MARGAVLRRSAALRWLAVAVLAAAIGAIPSVVARWPTGVAAESAATLLQRVRASENLAYAGYVEASGALPLPTVGILRETTQLLGDDSRLRVWWAAPTRWRVDQLTATGENDSYRFGDDTVLWDSSRRQVTDTTASDGPHLPTPVDVLPPQLGRRLLAAASARDLRAGTVGRIAGHPAQELVVTPHDPRTLAGRIGVWVDLATGLPLRVTVVARGTAVPALTTGFAELTLRAPEAKALDFRAPPDAVYAEDAGPDIAQLADRYPPYALPDQVAGLPRRGDVHGGVGSYGTGFALVVVVPLTPGHAQTLVQRYSGATPTHTRLGDETVMTTPLLTGVLLAAPDRGYAVVGTVPLRVINAVLADLAGSR